MRLPAAVAGALAWLAAACVGAALQPARDARASERLQRLRDRSAIPHHALVFVMEVLWTSPAGQRIVAVDVRSGDTREIWLAERTLEPGTFALLISRGDSWRIVDFADPRQVVASRHHERAIEAHQRARSARAAKRTHRREREAAAEVVRAAEGLLR